MGTKVDVRGMAPTLVSVLARASRDGAEVLADSESKFFFAGVLLILSSSPEPLDGMKERA